ncbi:integrase arm-type DNA-binding domain-containing protein [Bradyrhizobium sp. LB11.1]|uniref:tyrosine-type recombinase/integrase n=1 Tax=Bradyrhizobium sp. LB11.1 TaxID=3156326 RepID=UPI0033974155
MARKINRLNARAVATLNKPGRHADGGNLYLSISPNGGRSWVFMYRWHGRTVELGFGSARDVTLARARERATEARAAIAERVNPKGIRVASAGVTFGEAADQLIEAMRPSWRSAKHAAQWVMTLKTYAAPLRRLPVDAVCTDDVLGVLRPLWNATPTTAGRVRGRIERVLDAAKAQGFRSGDNPARWRGHLDQLLPKRQRITRGHHAAMPYSEVPAFIIDLRAREAVAAIALEFAILTAARSGEVLGATWPEFDFDGALWTVPASRMKAGTEHRVPLAARALAIVREMHELRTCEYVFPGYNGRRALSARAFGQVPSRMNIEGATVHGFRSSFRDWASEQTTFSGEVCEMALAHTIRSVTERAYRRGDLLDKRRELMAAWGSYCAKPPAKVIEFAGREVTVIGKHGFAFGS